MKYKYKSWRGNTNVEKIMEEVEKICEVDPWGHRWEVLSHSHSAHGMSIIFGKEKHDK